MIDDQVRLVDVCTDRGGLMWTVCRQCGDGITEVWGSDDDGRVSLAALVRDAIDHVCGFGYATD